LERLQGDNTCPAGSSDLALSVGCVLNALARDNCLPMWLLVLSGLLGLSGYDSLSEEVALSVTLQFNNPLPCLYFNSTQNTTKITLKSLTLAFSG